MLEFAAKQGDYLIVSVASDQTVRALKREPIICEAERLRMVQALKCVDEAFISRGPNKWNDFSGYIENIRPDVWVIDRDDVEAVHKEGIALALGIELVFKKRYQYSYSTTGLINEIISRNSNLQSK